MNKMNNIIKQRIEKINNGQVPEGYKKTEFGIFPCDWVTDKSFGDLFIFYGGLGKSREELTENGIEYLHYGDMHRADFNIASLEQYSKLPKYDTVIKGDESFLMQDGDVAFLDASEDLEGTSRSILIDNPENKPFIAGLHIICGKSTGNDLTKYYKQYITRPEYVKKQFQKLASGFKVYGLNRNTITGIKYAYPQSATEQEKIAEILMKWDEAIELQEKYIEKTNQQRTFLLKKVFDPKQNWSYQTLGDNVDLLASGGTPSTKILKYFDGNIIWVSIDDISQSGKYISKSNRTLSLEGLQNSSAKLFPKGTILYAMYASIGKCAIANTDCATSQAILGIIPSKNSFDNQYLYYYLCSIQERISTQGQQGTQANLNKGLVESFKIPTPMKNGKIDIDEQKRISKILIAIDNTITLNTKKLESIKQQRKALQQYLLNGIVRVER